MFDVRPGDVAELIESGQFEEGVELLPVEDVVGEEIEAAVKGPEVEDMAGVD